MDRFLPMQSVVADSYEKPASCADAVTISCYDNEIPSFVATEIDRLYQHLGCSLSNFSVMKKLAGASTYVARKGTVIVTVLLFRRERNQVTVLSEFIRLDQAAVQLFANTMFNKFSAVRMVSFNKIHTEVRRMPYPYQSVNCTEDIVVMLPQTVKQYQDQLGKNMRRNIKRYGATLQQDFPSYHYQVYLEQQVSEADIRAIIKLNRSRMAGKKIVSRIDEEETQWIVRLVRQCGIVGVAKIDGQVCGGAIGFRIGENYFMHVIAHDPVYNSYSLGILCYYLTICEGIVRGGKRFHLSWGRYEYKYRLLGETVDIAQLKLYRNRAYAVLYGYSISKAVLSDYARRSKLWLLEAERRDGQIAHLAAKLMRVLRTLKRSNMGGLLNNHSAEKAG
jgi:hypothetical protein